MAFRMSLSLDGEGPKWPTCAFGALVTTAPDPNPLLLQRQEFNKDNFFLPNSLLPNFTSLEVLKFRGM